MPIAFAAVMGALALTGVVSARMGHPPRGGAVWRNVMGGAAAMAITYGVGTAIGGFS